MIEEHYMPIIHSNLNFDDLPDELKERTKTFHIRHLRQDRNELLGETDKYMLSDYPITQEQKNIIANYRQQLRDFSKNNFEIPIKPSFI